MCLGWEVLVSMLYGYWKYIIDMFLLVVDVVMGIVFVDFCYVVLDDMGFDVFDWICKGGKYCGYLWCVCGIFLLVVFVFIEIWWVEEIILWIYVIFLDIYI